MAARIGKISRPFLFWTIVLVVSGFFIFAHAASAAGILMSPAEIAALPMSGSAWTALKAAADASAGTPDITCNQDSRTHPGTALAAGIVYARTGTTSYRDKAIALVEAARATARDCGNAILSLGRQLGAYVLAADFANYRDAGFVSWVSSIRTRDFPSSHGRWHVLVDTAVDSSSNWGTFALASLTVADAYLQDAQGLARDWSLFNFYGTTGGSFSHTSSYQAAWACPEGYPINPASCTDPRKEGAAVEDASRTSFPTLGNYPAESPQGYVVTAEVLFRQGYPAWTVNNAQVCRNAKWRERGGNLNRSSADRYVTWITNARCGFSQPTTSAGFGRVFGFTDWLFSGATTLPPPSPTPTPDTTAPSTPTNLSATAVSSSQINLSWVASTDNVGVTGYKIYRGGTQIGTTATANYSNTGLTASTNYSYTAAAYDAAGNTSGQSASANATTQATNPTPTTYTLTISKSGTGTGTVSGTGISCGSTCSTTLNSGTSITITATPASGSTFGGWSGSCSGTGSCTVSMTTNRNVTATFNTSTPTPTPTGIFSLGQQVQAISKVNVRQTPAGTLLGTQSTGAIGTVTAGPVSAVLNGNNVTWWTIDFNSGVDGWVGDDNLISYGSLTPTPTIVTGDFNRDGLVNSIDLSLMTTYWNQNNATYDLNHDGIVNSLDYVIMVQNWSA